MYIEPEKFIKIGIADNRIVQIDWRELSYLAETPEDIHRIVKKHLLNSAIFLDGSVSNILISIFKLFRLLLIAIFIPHKSI